MARKGTAQVKRANKNDKYFFLDSDSDEVTPSGTASGQSRNNSPQKRQKPKRKDGEASSPKTPPEQLNLSKTPESDHGRQPRQAAAAAVEPEKTFATEPLPPTDVHKNFINPPNLILSDEETNTPSRAPIRRTASTTKVASGKKVDRQPYKGNPTFSFQPSEQRIQQQEPQYPSNMIPGGASIPTNQQRNMRACMVCSIVRTQQQFMTAGCPNCEDFLELAGNSEQVNDCTSQVFEGLISVSDTKKSWVARYQRLEGYVPGVYATQVEGILPDDVIVAVENAGVNYVPRDGSEQEMLPKDS